MKLTLLTCLSLILATPLISAERAPWVGYWAANAKWCARAGDVGEETPDRFDETGMYGLEWGCEITSVKPTGIGQSWAIRTACMSMGDEYNENALFMITQDDRLLVISEYGETHDLIRCDKVPE